MNIKFTNPFFKSFISIISDIKPNGNLRGQSRGQQLLEILFYQITKKKSYLPRRQYIFNCLPMIIRYFIHFCS